MKYLSLVTLLVLTLSSYSQKLDSSIFSSEYEYKVFHTHLNEEDIEVIDLLVSVDGDDRNKALVESEIQKIIQKLEASGIRKKNTKAQIKQIYKTVHSSNLSKYDEKVFFSDIFDGGEYNCVTASALYAIVLEYFEVPFQIKETPNHVYLIGDPDETQILIESTNPSNGVVVYDHKTKKQYVDYLVENKIISKMDVSTSTVDEVFDAYYNKDTDINLYELTALQYYNKGIFFIEEGNYLEASIAFEKSSLLYSSVNTEFMFKASLLNLLSEEYQNKEYAAKSLTRFINNFSNTDEDINIGLSYYESTIQELLIENSNFEAFQSFQKEFKETLDAHIDPEKYMNVYYPKMGFYAYSQDDYAKSLEYFNLAYLADTNNLRLKMAVQEMVARNVFTDKDHEAMIDTMNYYFDVYPFLYEKEQFQRYYTYLYVHVSEEYLEKNNYAEAERYLRELEPILLKNNMTEVFYQYIESLYIAISSNHIMHWRYTAAISCLNSGMRIMPESKVLPQLIHEIELHDNEKPQLYYAEETKTMTPAEFSEEFSTYFPNCWELTKASLDGEEQSIDKADRIIIKASKYSKVTITMDNETITGRWTIRPKSRLLYLIPEDDKEDYAMFKIVKITENQLELRMYEGKSCNKEVMIFNTCD